MAAVPLPIEYPIRGVHTDGPRSAQPPGTCWDSLNMLSYDRAERARGAQRTGTSKLWATALGNGAQDIQLLDQTTIALDPSTVSATTLLGNEPFTYADGALQTVATTAQWRTYTPAGASNTTIYNIVSNKVTFASAASGLAVYQPNITLGTAYVLKLDFTIPASFIGTTAGLCCRINKTTPSAAGIYAGVEASTGGLMILKLGTAQLGTTLGSYTSPAVFFTLGQTYTLELRVNGDAFQVAVNGIVYITATSSNANTQSGIGFHHPSTNVLNTHDNWQVYTGTNLATYRQTNIVAVCGGNVYVGDISTQGTLALGGATQLFDTGQPEGAYSQGFYYMVDGFNIRKLQLSTRSMITYAATAGTAPLLCTLSCIWRDRLILAAPRDTPQNLFFSRIGTHTDWDYSQTDTAAAFAGNQSAAGRIGEPVVALLPMGDDVLGVGGDHNFWAIRGDLADGGSIDVISNAVGILGARAWCQDPTGVIWFVGTGGLYKWANGQGVPAPISSTTYNSYFASIDRSTNRVICRWDRARWLLNIYITPVNSATTIHLSYDARKEAFLPQQFPNAFGPTSALVYDGDGPNDRVELLGGRTGLIQRKSDTAKSDDGTAISSYVIIGPMNPGGMIGRSRQISVDLAFADAPTGYADSDFNCVLTVQSDDDVNRASSRTLARYRMSKTYSKWGRQARWINRQVGCYFYYTLSNNVLNKTFAFESGVARHEPAGRTRVG